jgi:hypothetical protein
VQRKAESLTDGGANSRPEFDSGEDKKMRLAIKPLLIEEAFFVGFVSCQSSVVSCLGKRTGS